MRLLIVQLTALLACADGPNKAGPPGPRDFVVTSDAAALSARLRASAQPVPVVSPEGALTLPGSTTSSLSLTLIAEVTPPVVGGAALVATSLAVDGARAAVTYARLGPEYGGAVEVVDLSTPSAPTVESQAIFVNADVNAAAIRGGNLYLALAGEDLGFNETAAVHNLGLSGAIITTSTNARVALAGNVGTAVTVTSSVVYAASASNGGVYALDRAAFAVTASVALDDARAVSAKDGAVAVHGGDQVHVFDTVNLGGRADYTLPSAPEVGAKAQVFLAGGKAYATAGSNGLHVISASTGAQLQTLTPPAAAGSAAQDIQLNGLGWSGSYVFAAYGGAGTQVIETTNALDSGTSEVNEPLAYSGRLGLPAFASANDLALVGTTLAVASGQGGALIVDLAPATNAVDISAASGLDEQVDNADPSVSGIAWADYDADGHLDVAIAGSGLGVTIYFGSAGGAFTPVRTGVSNHHALVTLDANDDGTPDVFSGDSSPNLFTNDGARGVSNEARAGITSSWGARGLAVDDVNADGLDDILYFANSGNYVALNQGTSMPASFVTEPSGSTGLMDAMSDYGSASTYVAAAYLNGDDDLDFMLNFDTGRLFLSNGDGTFTRDERGIAFVTAQWSSPSFADYDNDNDMDLFFPDSSSGRTSYLFRNDGGSFVDVTDQARIRDSDRHKGSCWGDYDSDGDLDLLVTVDVLSGSGPDRDSLLYRNNGDGTFQLLDDGMTANGESEDCMFVDYDLDGDLDLLVVEEDAPNTFIRNDLDRPNFLLVRPLGSGAAGGSSRIGRGIRVQLYEDDGTTFLGRREVGTQQGAKTSPLIAHFGGVQPTGTYVVKTFFRSGSVTSTITPANTSSDFNGRTIEKMLTVAEP